MHWTARNSVSLFEYPIWRVTYHFRHLLGDGADIFRHFLVRLAHQVISGLIGGVLLKQVRDGYGIVTVVGLPCFEHGIVFSDS